MASNQGRQVRKARALESSPTVACRYCPRHCYTKSGLTRHIQAYHPAEHESYEHSPSPPPSPTSCLVPLSPIFSDYMPPPSNHTPSPPRTSPPPDYMPSPFSVPLHLDEGADPAALDSDAEEDLGLANVGLDVDIVAGDGALPIDGDDSDFDVYDAEQLCADVDLIVSQVPGTPSITRTYHRKLNGKSMFFLVYTGTKLMLCLGRVCDEDGNDIPLDTPPPPRGSNGPDDWFPFNGRIQFEVADFIYRQNQMSAAHINHLLSLWAASLAIHEDEPPFSNATHLYNVIDSIPLGDVSWESFTLRYNGPQPVENAATWMQTEYDVWYRNPRTLVHNILSNSSLQSGFDYVPYQEHTVDKVHRFQDFMSGNWAWNQAVSLLYNLRGLVLTVIMLGYHRCRSANPWLGLLSHYSR